MATWRKKESLSRALGREGKGIAKGVVKGLLSNRDIVFASVALERGTGRHMTESGTPFTHISNRPKGGSSVLSGFLTGGSRNPSLGEIFYGRVFRVDVKYDSYDISDNVCNKPTVKCVTRKFYDLGRRRLFLAAVLIGGPYFTEQARALIEALSDKKTIPIRSVPFFRSFPLR